MVDQFIKVPALPVTPTPLVTDGAVVVHNGKVMLATLLEILALRKAKLEDGDYGAITVSGNGTVFTLNTTPPLDPILSELVAYPGDPGGGITVYDPTVPEWRSLAIGANLTFDGTTLAATGGGGGLPAATQAEMEGAAINSVAATPLAAKWSPSACKAWATFDGTTSPPTVVDGWNFDNVAKNGTGDYSVSWTNPGPTGNYAVFCLIRFGDSGGGSLVPVLHNSTPNPSPGGVRILTQGFDGLLYDPKLVTVSAFWNVSD